MIPSSSSTREPQGSTRPSACKGSLDLHWNSFLFRCEKRPKLRWAFFLTFHSTYAKMVEKGGNVFNQKEFHEKRKAEYDFFLSMLKDLGDEGMRPHQALAYLYSLIPEKRRNDDKFYWEGVFGPKFTSEKPDDLPEGYTWSTLDDKK